MLATAPRIGIRAARTPPKTTTMMTSEMGRAMPSPRCRSTWIWSVMSSTSSGTPPQSTASVCSARDSS